MGAKDWLTKTYGLRSRLESLEKGVLALRKRVAKLEARAPIIVPIETLTPEPYELLKPFHAVVEFCDDSYIATFYDANISASGDTQQEAVENLKDMVVAGFETLTEHEVGRLGPALVKQLRVLREFMRRKTQSV